MVKLLANIAIVAALLAAMLAGGALFFIARQDDSRAGRLVGLLAMAMGALLLLWMIAGNRWF